MMLDLSLRSEQPWDRARRVVLVVRDPNRGSNYLGSLIWLLTSLSRKRYELLGSRPGTAIGQAGEGGRPSWGSSWTMGSIRRLSVRELWPKTHYQGKPGEAFGSELLGERRTEARGSPFSQVPPGQSCSSI